MSALRARDALFPLGILQKLSAARFELSIADLLVMAPSSQELEPPANPGRFMKGWSYAYAGWYQRLLGLAERGWLPVVIADSPASSLKRINLQDLRPAEWQSERDTKPSLPLPPAGKQQDELR